MRKNFTYDVKKVYSRNELVDAIDSESMVIEILGSALEEMEKEYKKGVATEKIAKAFRNFTGLGFILAIFNPGAALAEVLFMGVTALVSGTVVGAVELKKYALTVFTYRGKEHFILIRYSKFDDKLDSITGFDGLCFSSSKSCPKCGRKIKFSKKSMGPERCPKCAANVIYYTR